MKTSSDNKLFSLGKIYRVKIKQQSAGFAHDETGQKMAGKIDIDGAIRVNPYGTKCNKSMHKATIMYWYTKCNMLKRVDINKLNR